MRSLLPLAVCLLPLAAGADDLLIADFESADYGGWTATGDAFGDGPAAGTLPNQMTVTGFEGDRLVNSYLGGDAATGTLTSPPLTIERPYINLLVGGGGYDTTQVRLVVDGQPVRTASGPNTQPGGSEELDWVTWDMADLIGQTARIVIVDERTGGWGHISVDHIMQSDTPREKQDRSRMLAIHKPYLLLPIDDSADRVWITVRAGESGEAVAHRFEANLHQGDGEPDWIAHLPVGELVGQTVTIEGERLSNETALDAVRPSDTIGDRFALYDERLRPQLRFSQQRGWNNDPNGMTYDGRRWHFFWQSNPVGNQWGNMYWGHASSPDLIHWTEHPHALRPYVDGEGKMFSGGGNVTRDGRLFVAFTDTGAGEAIAIADADGEVRPIGENPVIRHRGRDPKPFWHEPSQRWIIAVYDEVPPEEVGAEPEIGDDGKEKPARCIAFYRSVGDGLTEWELTSRIVGFYECPEIFELPIDGDSTQTQTETKWVLFGGDARYIVGQFDGERFVPDAAFWNADSGTPSKRRLHHGQFYASQCFTNDPRGRVVQVGWSRVAMDGMPFNQAFTLPIHLTLHRDGESYELRGRPVEEIATLRQDATIDESNRAIGDGVTYPLDGQLYDIELTVTPADAKSVRIGYGGSELVYDATAKTLSGVPCEPIDGRLRIRIVTDRPMSETIVNDGRAYLTRPRPDGGQPLGELTIMGDGDATIESLTVYPMRSIWRD